MDEQMQAILDFYFRVPPISERTREQLLLAAAKFPRPRYDPLIHGPFVCGPLLPPLGLNLAPSPGFKPAISGILVVYRNPRD